MRLSFFATILPIALSLASLTAARGYDSGLSYEARNYVDDLATREILSELTTRELIDELSDRLERRRGRKPTGGSKVICAYCRHDWARVAGISDNCPARVGKNEGPHVPQTDFV
ncbi:hypothetical protein DFP72DRAFT_1102310 [Ephemerocybe angulata]|uniref:Uncharacterized protein n=1 Tax=Ephemerocybe angulata TaxID=980116 RepID=A0A8H6I755_9AGAR|nr:hypothetical protein DFP72DRAFT_1142640 [Tulosesus angulatus]KAF6759134.1 hypothetical protein DFP72DRAFT_1102310 [Tulosesus angulatus]